MWVPRIRISLIDRSEHPSGQIRERGGKTYIYLHMSTLIYRFEKLRLLLEGGEGVIPLRRIQHLIYVPKSRPF